MRNRASSPEYNSWQGETGNGQGQLHGSHALEAGSHTTNQGQLSHTAWARRVVSFPTGQALHNPGTSTWPRPEMCASPLVVTRAMGTHTDPCRTMDPDMALCSSIGQNLSMAAGGIAGYSRQAVLTTLASPVLPLFFVTLSLSSPLLSC